MTIVSFPDAGKLKPVETVKLELKLNSSAFSSVLTESARIARAAPRPLTELTADQVLVQSFTNVRGGTYLTKIDFFNFVRHFHMLIYGS